MRNKLLGISLGVLILSLFVSCASVNKLVQPEKKAFQERAFDSKRWRDGDAQTRGEMSKDLRWKRSESDGDFLRSKTQSEILAILGEPDRKTRGKCCGAGGTSDEEVWLYDLEVLDVKDAGDSKTKTEHFQLYFMPGGKVDDTRVSLWDDKKPDYFPRVG